MVPVSAVCRKGGALSGVVCDATGVVCLCNQIKYKDAQVCKSKLSDEGTYNEALKT